MGGWAGVCGGERCASGALTGKLQIHAINP
jgi:hypothetical protein